MVEFRPPDTNFNLNIRAKYVKFYVMTFNSHKFKQQVNSKIVNYQYLQVWQSTPKARYLLQSRDGQSIIINLPGDQDHWSPFHVN